jgi:hypothetical protein
MGMFTEMYLAVRLVEDVPEDVLNVLKYMFGGEQDEPEVLPEHEFFECHRWASLGRSASHYFIPFATSVFRYNDIANNYFLVVRTDLKNYDSEITKFLSWIDDYIDACEGEHIGHFRYEEDDKPTLVYKGDYAART